MEFTLEEEELRISLVVVAYFQTSPRCHNSALDHSSSTGNSGPFRTFICHPLANIEGLALSQLTVDAPDFLYLS
jgi:hypothetical protein